MAKIESRWRRSIRDGAFWTEDDAREALAECERSGESVAAFARRHGLVARRLYWWRHELRKKSGMSHRAQLLP